MAAERIGLLGGSFDPVHMGHLIMAQAALEAERLDRILFIPCRRQPLKQAATPAPARHRLAMVEAAVADNPRFEACDIEIRRAGVSYSIDTVRTLRARYPTARLFLILGADALLELHRWREADAVLASGTVVTVMRPGNTVADITPARLHLPASACARLKRHSVAGPGIGVSSTAIRERVAQSRPIRYLVPSPVEAYIDTHGLYRAAGKESVSKQ